ncbi:DUF1761 domain-containing protein [Emcibacter sp.]|uniref:DUF1761 domain-containing protein n=1 Tax=Emcibacter sp. TaxID=1979954 RepID=UPI003A8CD086
MGFENISMLAVLAAAVAKFALGGLWYSSLLFGRTWMNELRLRETDLDNPRFALIVAAIVSIIAALAMAVIIDIAGLPLLGCLILGLVIGIGVSAANLSLQFAFEGRSFRLYMIYAGQYLCEAVLMAGIIGYFQ